jgi:hypothetical protein
MYNDYPNSKADEQIYLKLNNEYESAFGMNYINTGYGSRLGTELKVDISPGWQTKPSRIASINIILSHINDKQDRFTELLPVTTVPQSKRELYTNIFDLFEHI